MILIGIGFVVIALAVRGAVYLVRLPSEQPLPDLRDHGLVPPGLPRAPEIAGMDLPMFVVLGSLLGFALLVIGVLQLLHLVPAFP